MKKQLAQQLGLGPGRPPPLTLERPGAQAPRSFRAPVTRQDGRQLRKKSVYLDVQLDNALGAYAREHGLTDSDAIAQALRALLGLGE